MTTKWFDRGIWQMFRVQDISRILLVELNQEGYNLTDYWGREKERHFILLKQM